MNKIWRRWKGKFNCYEYRDEQEIALGAAQPRVEDGWEEFELASRPAAAAPTAEQILALERRSPMSDDEALRFGRAVLLLASRPAAAAPPAGVTAWKAARLPRSKFWNIRRCGSDGFEWVMARGKPVDFASSEEANAVIAALAGAAQGAEPSALRGALEEIAAMEYDKWSNGARAGEIARNALAMQSQSIPVTGVTGATVADRLDAMADREQAGSQASSDLYAAATVWRKHLKAGAAQGAEPVAYALRFPSDTLICLSTVFDTRAEAQDYLETCSEGTEIVPLYTSPQLPTAQGAEPDAWRFQWRNGDVGFMDAGETADRLRKGVVGEDGTAILNPDSGRTNWKPLVYAASPQPPTGTEKKKDAEPVVHQGMTIAGDGAAMLGRLMREQRASRLGVYPDGNPNAGTEKP